MKEAPVLDLLLPTIDPDNPEKEPEPIVKLFFDDDSEWRSSITNIWGYYFYLDENDEIAAFKLDLTEFNIYSGVIEIDLSGVIEHGIDIDEIPAMTPEQKADPNGGTVIEVIATGYKNAYFVMNNMPTVE